MLKKLHHNAYRCRDSEATRKFYEDFLGMPLANTVEIKETKSGRQTDAAFTLPESGSVVNWPVKTPSFSARRGAINSAFNSTASGSVRKSSAPEAESDSICRSHLRFRSVSNQRSSSTNS